jgi:hypothetical protein
MGKRQGLFTTCPHAIKLDHNGPLLRCIFEKFHPGEHSAEYKCEAWPYLVVHISWDALALTNGAV